MTPQATAEITESPKVTMKAYKMRAYPTHGQEVRANKLLRVHCDIYNACLEERIKAWKMNRVSVNYFSQCAQLKHIRTADPNCGQFSYSAQQRTLKRVDRAFKSFFDRCKIGAVPGFPRFKPWHRFNVVDHAIDDGSKWTPTEGKWARGYFKGVGHIKVKEHRAITGDIKTLSIVRDGRKWWVVAVVAVEIDPLPETGRSVGIDVGINRFLTTSDGEIVENPRLAAGVAGELADLQRRLAPLGGQSKNLRRKIRKLHRKTKNQRLDFHHQTARRLVDSCDVIALEDLDVANMSKRPKPKPDPETPGSYLPNGAAAKSGLNRSIADVGWSQFRSILTAKAESAGRVIIAVNPAYTSIRCHVCDATCTRPTTPIVICPEHGEIDADVNGARNVLKRAGTGSHLSLAT